MHGTCNENLNQTWSRLTSVVRSQHIIASTMALLQKESAIIQLPKVAQIRIRCLLLCVSIAPVILWFRRIADVVVLVKPVSRLCERLAKNAMSVSAFHVSSTTTTANKHEIASVLHSHSYFVIFFINKAKKIWIYAFLLNESPWKMKF